MKILRQVLLLCFLLSCTSAECSEVQLVEGNTRSPSVHIQSKVELRYVRLDPYRGNYDIRFEVIEDETIVGEIDIYEQRTQTVVYVYLLTDTGLWSVQKSTFGFSLERPQTRLRLAYFNRTLIITLYNEQSNRWLGISRDSASTAGTGALSISTTILEKPSKFLIMLPCRQQTEITQIKTELEEAVKRLGEAEQNLGEAEKNLGETEKKLAEAEKKLADAEDSSGKAQDSSVALLATTIALAVLAAILVSIITFVCCSSRWRRPAGVHKPEGGVEMKKTTTQEQGLEGGPCQGNGPPVNKLRRSTSHESINSLYGIIWPR